MLSDSRKMLLYGSGDFEGTGLEDKSRTYCLSLLLLVFGFRGDPVPDIRGNGYESADFSNDPETKPPNVHPSLALFSPSVSVSVSSPRLVNRFIGFADLLKTRTEASWSDGKCTFLGVDTLL